MIYVGVGRDVAKVPEIVGEGKRGLDFEDAPLGFAGKHFTREDDRKDYGEVRLITAGLLWGRMVVMIWTPCNVDDHMATAATPAVSKNRIDRVMRLHYHSGVNPDPQETAMAATLEVESTLTDRYQTTVPETVRRALKLGKRDKIHYTIRPSGEVVLTRVEASDGDDPVLGQFLGFLAADITRHPERLQAVDVGLVQRLQSLVGGVDVDLDAALSADDE